MSKPIKKSQPKPRLDPPIEFYDDQTAVLRLVLPFSEIQLLLGGQLPFQIKPDNLISLLKQKVKDPNATPVAKKIARQLVSFYGKYSFPE